MTWLLSQDFTESEQTGRMVRRIWFSWRTGADAFWPVGASKIRRPPSLPQPVERRKQLVDPPHVMKRFHPIVAERFARSLENLIAALSLDQGRTIQFLGGIAGGLWDDYACDGPAERELW